MPFYENIIGRYSCAMQSPLKQVQLARRRFMRLLLGAMLAVVLVAAMACSGPTPAPSPESVFRPGACAGDYTGLTNKIECGTLVVPETRGGPSTRQVALPVTIVRASAPKPGAVPVVYLHGGPGAAAVENLGDQLRDAGGRELIALDQDWIFFDQRGAGLSAPALDCGAVALTDAGPLTDAAAGQLTACAGRLRASGVDLSRYNAEEVVKDIQDLRTALKLDRIDLFGISYGTRIALAAVKHAPDGVRAVVLDSPWTPEATWAENGPAMVSDAVREIFNRCAADPACQSRYPTAAAQLDTLANKLLGGPQTVNGKTYTADDLGAFLMDAAYSATGARALPATAARFSTGNMAELDTHRAERSSYHEAQHLTHLCKEEIPFENEATMRQRAQRDPVTRLLVSSMGRYFQVCRDYPVGPPDPVEAQPVSSELPTLFLAAEIDPGCPAAVAKAAAARFPKGQLSIIPNATHGVFEGSACARTMIRKFLADPDAPVDQSCLHPEHDKFKFTLE
ncbi:alpha/beta fold hydrolase [Pseudonocardia spinosispora]|uniref:alpha/beta fold hydrolase n=1 Tax=Pseudonocardia spinosispora TaxID=103441 RepID=UPI001B7FD69A|nr:alpha/beta fold hydrolase [Pseudonocardia spinosispora]